METTETSDIKNIVKEKYGEIAEQTREENLTGCCGSACGCGTIDSAILAEDYSSLKGYIPDADLGLGCGLPTQFANIREGDTVVDLGSGAGNDCFVARAATGVTGKVIGIDFTEKMVEKARSNAEKLGYNNVEFRHGDIEAMPLSSAIADVVVSNCVLNLVPDKHKVFSEILRVLKPGGHFSIADVVLDGHLPENLKDAAELYVGCISGAIQLNEYLGIVKELGFEEITLQKKKQIVLPDEILVKHISQAEVNDFRKSGTQVLSITLYARKPETKEGKKTVKNKEEACCEPGCCGN